MWVPKLIITGAALILVVLLYNLPKVVVDNQQEENQQAIGDPTNPEIAESHDRQLTEDQRATIADLKEAVNTDLKTEKSANFADSLAGIFTNLNYLDSAAYYYGIAAELVPQLDRLLKAGEGYFEAYSYAVDLEKQQSLGENVRKYFGRALEQDPNLNDAKVKIALTYLPEQPMQAVMLLREVVEQEPDHALGLYNLGLLSIQSQQFDKAVERFETLTENHPDHLEGQFYLGVSYFENGERTKALEQFERIKTMEPDPEVLASVDEYIKKLK